MKIFKAIIHLLSLIPIFIFIYSCNKNEIEPTNIPMKNILDSYPELVGHFYVYEVSTPDTTIEIWNSDNWFTLNLPDSTGQIIKADITPFKTLIIYSDSISGYGTINFEYNNNSSAYFTIWDIKNDTIFYQENTSGNREKIFIAKLNNTDFNFLFENDPFKITWKCKKESN